jgi:hypothetical protein
VWHITQNIRTHCRKMFPGVDEGWSDFVAGWRSLVSAPSEEMFDKCWATMELAFAIYPQALEYIRNLLTIKARWATPWTSQHLHYGNTSTSRLEGLHAQVKRYISGAGGDLFNVFHSINLAISIQAHEISARIAKDACSTPFHLNRPLTSSLLLHISSHTLAELSKQIELADRATKKSPLPACTNTFTRSVGIPCSHHVARLRTQGGRFEVSDFNSHWQLDQATGDNNLGMLLTIAEPVLRPPHAPHATAPQASTGRILSAFERIGGDGSSTSRPRLCGMCRTPGHNRTTCPRHRTVRYPDPLFNNRDIDKVLRKHTAVHPKLG